MSTKSAKTCECKVHEHSSQCFQIAGDGYFCPTAESDEVRIDYCPLHDGSMSMAGKLAEALDSEHASEFETRDGRHTDKNRVADCETCQLLAAYDELQGRKG